MPFNMSTLHLLAAPFWRLGLHADATLAGVPESRSSELIAGGNRLSGASTSIHV